MKPKEFYKILCDFVEEQKYWESLKVGDIIYQEVPRYGDIDYHKMRIDEINVDDRVVVAHDVENPKHILKLTHFMSEEMFEKL